MTEDSVVVSITIRVSEREVKIENEIRVGDMEESIQGIMLEAKREAVKVYSLFLFSWLILNTNLITTTT